MGRLPRAPKAERKSLTPGMARGSRDGRLLRLPGGSHRLGLLHLPSTWVSFAWAQSSHAILAEEGDFLYIPVRPTRGSTKCGTKPGNITATISGSRYNACKVDATERPAYVVNREASDGVQDRNGNWGGFRADTRRRSHSRKNESGTRYTVAWTCLASSWVADS